MEKFKVSFEANNQQLKALGTKHASDTYADIEATFVLGERWTDMDSVSAVWWNDFTRVATVLNSQGKCIVPHEVLARKGCVRVNLVGSIVEGDELITRLTSYSAEAVQVNEKIKLTGNEPQSITPSQYEQFVQNVKTDANRAEQSATDAKTYADEAEASAQNASESASASAVSASDSARSATASAESAQNASEIAVEVEVMKNEVELAKDKVLGMRATAETLEAGSDATASYSDGLLTLGIPRGDQGIQGIQGETGATPNLTIGTVETLAPTEDATATITGTAENPVLNLGLPKGDTGEVSRAELDNAVTDLKSNINVIDNNLAPIYADYYRYDTVDISEELQNGFYENGVYYAHGNYRAIRHNCSVGERYKISTYLRLVNHWAIVYFYNSSDVLVAKYGGDADGTLTEDTYYENYEVEVPNGATYFVVSSYLVNNKPLKLAQWEEIDHSANYREVSFRYLENLNIQNGIYDHGTFYPNVSYQTVKVPCVPGDVFKIDAYYYGASRQPVAQFYNSNMSLIGTTAQISETGQQNNVLVIIPDECAYVVFVNYIIADTVNFNIRKYVDGEYPLFQKNYIALGDSITAIKDGWRPWFQKATGANEILCTAVSGATLCDYDDTVVDGNPEATAHSNTISNQVQEILNDPPSEDINFIVISAGTNDHASASEIDGGVTQFVDHSTNTYIDVDTVDRTRYDGAMRWVAEKLWSQFPNADIFWCTPIQGAEDVRQTWVQIRKCDYMKEVASHLACPVIDATRNSGIYGRYETRDVNGKYLRDGLHPNMYGRKKLGLFYASEIINYYSHEID